MSKRRADGGSRRRDGGEGAATDLFDLLVWGGAGTRMNGDLPALLGKWGKVVRKQASEAARAERNGGGEA